MVMGSVSWKGESWDVAMLSTVAQLKIEDVCILCNVIEFFWQRYWVW
jgi:hypothetical protein